jgi:hypothetical protein
MTAAQTLTAMKKWKVPYREYPGWGTRGRDPEHGPFSDVHGIMIHHTGSDAGQSDAYLKFLFVDGRSDLPGPLCNVSTDMDGDLHLGAQGRANHAGSGSSSVLSHVTHEDYAGYKVELKPGPDSVDGNANFYGNEVRYDGGQPMTDKQWAAAVLWAAAVCDFHGWSALAVIGHREWTTRKPDPGNCPMYRFRSAVDVLLKAGPPGTPTPSKETGTMAAADADRVIAAMQDIQRTTEAGRYADLKKAITEWSETKDNARQKVLLDAITANTKAINDLIAAVKPAP